MPNFDFSEKGLGAVFPKHFVYGFSKKGLWVVTNCLRLESGPVKQKIDCRAKKFSKKGCYTTNFYNWRGYFNKYFN